MKKKCVLLDFDGTMADTVADIAASVNHAIHVMFGLQYGIDLEQCRKTVGRGLRNELKDSLIHCKLDFNDDSLDRGLNILESYYLDHPCDHTLPYEGMVSALKTCNDLNLHLGVFSNKADQILRIVMKQLFFQVCFDYICGMSPSIPRKPSPAGVLRFINEMGIEPDCCLYIGDSEVDWQTGQNAGVETRIVTWGFRSRSELIGMGVSSDALIDTMDQLESEFRRFAN
jgi:phosphoglycolate phosphatase